MASWRLNSPPVRSHALAGLLVLLWILFWLAFAISRMPDIYWFSYFSVDYSQGFVRRGLAGKLVHLFSAERYFTALHLLRWLPTLAFSLGLSVLAWTVAMGSGRSERRLMLALLVPMLPFGAVYGLLSARPDLLGATALMGLALALRKASSDRGVIAACTVFGAMTALLTLAHEAIPFLFGLGALLALNLLTPQLHPARLRWGAIMALAPGLLAACAVVVLGQKGLSGALCERIPHGFIALPLPGLPSLGQWLRGFQFEMVYHAWMCRNITPLFDQTAGDGFRFVLSIGAVGLLASSLLGLALLMLTLWAIGVVGGVPLRRMATVLRSHSGWGLFGVALYLPLFLTGVDWTRWWVMMAFNVGVVLLLFVSRDPASSSPPTAQTRRGFFLCALALALPLGCIPGFGAPFPL